MQSIKEGDKSRRRKHERVCREIRVWKRSEKRGSGRGESVSRKGKKNVQKRVWERRMFEVEDGGR